jgi:integrase
MAFGRHLRDGEGRDAGVAAGRRKDRRGPHGRHAAGSQKLRRYVEEEWLPHHEMEARTRENYSYYLERRILPEFGSMRIVEILPLDVRRWVTKLKNDGVSPTVIRFCMTVLSAIFTTALNDQVTQLHPCRGVKTPPVPKRPRTIVSPEQFEAIYAALPSEDMRLLAELAIETGLRWGELTELRPRDIDFTTRLLTVSRVVVELVPKFHPTGDRFLVKPYPKDREHRRLKLNVEIAAKLHAHVVALALQPDDLLFTMPKSARPALKLLAHPETLGWTDPNSNGRCYRHGTLSAYSAGACRCRHCKDAYAHYRSQRRAAGKDQPRAARMVDTDGHIARRWFREPSGFRQFKQPTSRSRSDRTTYATPMRLGS